MSSSVEPLARLVEELERLPGVGRRTAERLAHHILNADPAEAARLADAIRDVKQRLRPCPQCFNTTDREICAVCAATDRDRTLLCVVEQTRDLLAIEAAGVYRGLYHVLGGRVSPHEGLGPERLTLAALERRLAREDMRGVREVIVATNPDAEGDTTALEVEETLRPTGLAVTRIARGLPTGGSIEFANVQILRDALRGRQRTAPPTGD